MASAAANSTTPTKAANPSSLKTRRAESLGWKEEQKLEERLDEDRKNVVKSRVMQDEMTERAKFESLDSIREESLSALVTNENQLEIQMRCLSYESASPTVFAVTRMRDCGDRFYSFLRKEGAIR